MTTDNRLDYIIGRVDEACDRLARLEQQVSDHVGEHDRQSVFRRWLLPVVVSLLTLTVSACTFALGYYKSPQTHYADHTK